MVSRLQPSLVLNYGIPYEEMFDCVELVAYPDYWHSVKAKDRKYGTDEAYHTKQRRSDDDDFELDF